MENKKIIECAHDPEYYPSINEAGWRCVNCLEELGHRPDLDRELIGKKVMGLLNDLHESKMVYVSNGSQGEAIMCSVAMQCVREGRFDQYFIIHQILEDPNIDYLGHSDYYRQSPEKKIEAPQYKPGFLTRVYIRLFGKKILSEVEKLSEAFMFANTLPFDKNMEMGYKDGEKSEAQQQ